MSYILDALRRADSERERGAVPNLHAKPAPGALADADDDDGERRRPQPLVWAVIGLLLLIIAVLGWQFMGSRPPETAAPLSAPVAVLRAPVPEPAPAVVTPPPLPAPQPAAVAVAPALAPAQ
ncbi:MAG: hypothetical protein H7Y33_06995, partial [Cytophagales bacterium]|nr:hypothetical protein [Rhizobacter sp.]